MRFVKKLLTALPFVLISAYLLNCSQSKIGTTKTTISIVAYIVLFIGIILPQKLFKGTSTGKNSPPN